MKNAKEFLDLCQRRFPLPRKDLRHSLALEGDTLVLTLILQDYSHQRFNFDNEDLNKPASQLLSELIAVFKTPKKKPGSPNSVA